MELSPLSRRFCMEIYLRFELDDITREEYRDVQVDNMFIYSDGIDYAIGTVAAKYHTYMIIDVTGCDWLPIDLRYELVEEVN
jgi:hypothetical protein